MNKSMYDLFKQIPRHLYNTLYNTNILCITKTNRPTKNAVGIYNMGYIRYIRCTQHYIPTY